VNDGIGSKPMPPMSVGVPTGLFDDIETELVLSPGAVLLRGFASGMAAQLIESTHAIAASAPFRHLVTPGGRRMSVAMMNCGPLGWTSDAAGYRYTPFDPESGNPWPAMPVSFCTLATLAAARAGYADFMPDACLVNRYAPGARLTAHRDSDESDLSAPIVSVSLGLPAVFLWGGATRASRMSRLPLVHGDVVVWGGPSRLHYHGVDVLGAGHHPAAGAFRYNLTFRSARQPPR
jgi:alkylated DNA repair protein (DNA oxidative demethylase)